ncbi:MAG TPA: hypothetical protein VGL60_02925 [Acidimicrobiales bacterium]|jgi:hypothetical protein
MTQPSFVPIPESDQVRGARQLEVPGRWLPSRPGDQKGPRRQGGAGFGTPGPDQGYALLVAGRFEDRLRLAAGESAHDVIVGCAQLASRRAGLFGRAPTIYDVEMALRLFGFLDEAPPATVVADRSRRFAGVAHSYGRRQALVASVPEALLRQPVEQTGAGAALVPAPDGTASAGAALGGAALAE